MHTHLRILSIFAIVGLAAAGSADPAATTPAEPTRSGAPILERVAAGIFGSTAGKIAAIRVVYHATMLSEAEAGEIEQQVSYVFPDTVCHEVQTPMGRQSIVFDGKGGFISAGGHKLPLGDEAVLEGRRQTARDLILLAANVGDARLGSSAKGVDSSDGKSCEIVEVTFLGAKSELCVDASGRVVRQTFEGKHPFSGATGKVTLRYEDYAEVEGLMLPRRHVLAFDGEELLTIRLARVELNPDLSDVIPSGAE